MKQNNFERLFQDSRKIEAPEGFTKAVMSRITNFPNCERRIVLSPFMPTQFKKLGISMITTAMLLFITVFIPGNQLDTFNDVVQAQSQLINQQTDKAYEWAYNPLKELNKFMEDVDKKLNKIKEAR